MFDPLDTDSRNVKSRLAWLRRLAWASLLLERTVAAFWRPFFWSLFFTAIWLFRLPAMIGGAGEEATLLLFLLGLSYLLGKSFRVFSWPLHQDVDHRLETDSNLPHRPLSHIHDRLANPLKGETRNLWSESRKAAVLSLLRLKPSWPKSVAAGEDPAALRYAVLVLFIAGLLISGSSAPDRLREGLFPFSLTGAGARSGNGVTVLVTPPEYTGLGRITIQGQGVADKPVSIPEGSILKVQLSSGIGRPNLFLDKTKLPLERLGDDSWGVETPMLAAATLKVKQLFFTRFAFPVSFTKDKPPEITLTGEPATLPKGTLQIPLKVKDDYGVTDLVMRMTLDALVEDAPMGNPVHETRAVMSPPDTEIKLNPVYDLSWHSWAGLPVNISIEIHDHKAQRALLPPIKIVLPERVFYHPVAKQLVEMRQRLIWAPKNDRIAMAYEMETLLQTPGAFSDDPIVFLSIRSIASRLAYARPGASVMPVIAQMWDTALRIEDGNLSIAARNLRTAREKLENLLKNPEVTDDQLATAMTELQNAMAQYFQELYREMQKQLAEGEALPSLPPEALENALNAEDLAAFLDQLKAETLSGDRDTARQMLSQLQQMMDSLDPSMASEMPPELQSMAENISQLKELIEEQKGLLEQTREQITERGKSGGQSFSDFLPLDPKSFEGWGAGQMPPSPHDNPPPSSHSSDSKSADSMPGQGEQDALRYELGQIMLDAGEQLGEIPENMQNAEQEMRRSGEQLGEDKPQMSIPHQEKAINHLQDSQDQMQQQMVSMMKRMTIMSFGTGPTDPLGRPMDDGSGPSFLPSGKIEIPDESERKRAYEILEILRKRSGEFHRPDYELEYYRRLMRKF